MISRRDFGKTAAAAISTASFYLPAFHVSAAPLRYEINPVSVRQGVWVVPGAQEPIAQANGGAIANITIFDTSEGAVVVDTGPSRRYGEQLLALARQLTGKPVVRVYITHFHPDHVFGNQVFENGVVAAPQRVIDGLRRMGEDFSSAMYYLVGDWMRGTEVAIPGTVITPGIETVGDRKFHLKVLSGHTDCDLAIFEEATGVLVAGDLIFLDRAPTTPNADLARWRQSLAKLEELAGTRAGDIKVIPGHGPVHAPGRGREQTARWLDTIEGQIRACFDDGLSAMEAVAKPLPEWTRDIAAARYEYERSVLHFYPKLESRSWPRVDTQGG